MSSPWIITADARRFDLLCPSLEQVSSARDRGGHGEDVPLDRPHLPTSTASPATASRSPSSAATRSSPTRCCTMPPKAISATSRRR
jgi:hypothetical protein